MCGERLFFGGFGAIPVITQLFSGDVYQFCYMALIPNLLLMFEAGFLEGWFDFLTLVLATENTSNIINMCR